MKRWLMIIVMGWYLTAPSWAADTVYVFACEPEWASLASEVGGERVEVFSATHAKQDPHYIRARPSLIAKIRKADLVFCSGAELEAGWLPILLSKAKEQVQPGNMGHLMASDVVPMLDVPDPDHLDRSFGDVHASGNPHVHLNPHNMLLVADVLKNRLIALDPSHQSEYIQSHEQFRTRFVRAIAKWEKKAALLRGQSVIVHHKSFTYLLNWLGMDMLVSLEPKPGIAPSAQHLQHVLDKVKGNTVRHIILSPYDSTKASRWLENRSDLSAVTLPYTVGGDKVSADVFSLFERTIDLLLASPDA